jgi:nucleoside-diphosphate-sugar epimerase
VRTALIGHTGFVGGLLASRASFDLLIHRANLEELRDRSLERVVCAGLPAAKWIANRDPQADRANVTVLQDVLRTVTARSFVLISTIDIYPRIRDANEDFDCTGIPNHAYGLHRLEFEAFVRRQFPHATILRLPALFGPGLRKNVIFDLLNGNQLELINPESEFQWYPLEHLPRDIDLAEASELPLANLFTEPVPTRVILDRFFPRVAVGAKAQAAAHYDLHTRHARVFGGSGGYVMSAASVLEELGTFCGARQ